VLCFISLLNEVLKMFNKVRSRITNLMVLFAALAFFGSSVAKADENPWKIWAGTGAMLYEGDNPNESGILLDTRVGYNLDPQLTIEGGLSAAPHLERNDNVDINANVDGNSMWQLHTGLLYHVVDDAARTWDPYVKVALAEQYYAKERRGANFETFVGPGLGLAYNIDDNWSVRADYQMTWGSFARASVDHQVLAMVGFGWGGSSEGTGAGKGDELGGKSSGPLKTIYFDYDSSKLRPTEQTTLKSNSDWMKANPGKKVSVEGHCDERGTNDYNMALGQRRAQAAYDYLRSLGVPAEQMSTKSFGEEFPADPGHNEDAWRKNRRAESVVQK
jgi:peptidoglycan-associated lipoprotein